MCLERAPIGAGSATGVGGPRSQAMSRKAKSHDAAVIDLPTALVVIVMLPLIPGLPRTLEGRFASVTARYRATADHLAAPSSTGCRGCAH